MFFFNAFSDKNRAVGQQLQGGKGKCWNKSAFVKKKKNKPAEPGGKERRELAGEAHLNRKYI